MGRQYVVFGNTGVVYIDEETTRQYVVDGAIYISEDVPASNAVTATNFAGGHPSIGSPALQQNNVLTATSFQNAAVVFTAPDIVPAWRVIAAPLITGSPAIGSPQLKQIHNFSTSFATQSPDIGRPSIGVPLGNIVLHAANIVTGSPHLGEGGFGSGPPFINAPPSLTGDRHARRTGDDYANAFLDLLPQGQAWPRLEGSTLVDTVTGLSQIWGDVDGKAADLLEIEADPRTTNLMLPDWERNFGLPDPCIIFPPEDQFSRRVALVDKMTLVGRQDRAFFKEQAAKVGLNISIREYSPYQCGISGVGDTRRLATSDDPGDPNFRWGLGPAEMRFYWKVDLTQVLTGAECILRRYKPAHTDVVFTYSNVLDRASSLYYWLGI